MSIAYGHFSNALNSQASTGLVNGLATIYFTVPWYPASYVDRVRIFNTTGSTKNISNIGILTNAAHTRFGDNTIVDDYYYFDPNAYSVSTVSNNSAYYAINPAIYFEDAYSRPYIYLKVTLASNATNDIYFCDVSGRKALGTSYLRNDLTHIAKNKNFSVVMFKKTLNGLGTTVADVTMNAIGNAINNDNTSSFVIDDARDYIYVGSESLVDHWEFQVGTASTNAGALTGQYWWAGTAWSSFQVLDNTSSDGSGSLRFSGIIEGAGLGSSAWTPTILDTALNANLPTDIASSIGNSINKGLIYPTTMFNNPSRFWARFKVASIGDAAKFKAILPIHEYYS
jgi:hypothetical protein